MKTEEKKKSLVTTTKTKRPHTTIKRGVPEVQALPLIVVIVVGSDITKTIVKAGVGVAVGVTVNLNGERFGQIRLGLAHHVVQSVVPGADTNEFVRVEVVGEGLGRARGGTSEDITISGRATRVTDTSVGELGSVTIEVVPHIVSIVHQPLLGNLTATLILASESVGSSKKDSNQQKRSQEFHGF